MGGKEKKIFFFLLLQLKAPNQVWSQTDQEREEVDKSAQLIFFRTLFTYCREVSPFHDNALTPKCAVDLFWTSVIIVLNAGAKPRGGCVQSIRLEHSRASHK